MKTQTSSRKYPFSQVDAFTRNRFSGNPCAIVLNADDLSDEEMLAIAREMNLSETSFVLKSNKADFHFRYFTPAEEIPLAGHPTIATVHRLIELGLIPDNVDVIQVELKAGLIDVEIRRERSGNLISMHQPSPNFLRTYTNSQVLPLFGLEPEDLISGVPIQTVSTGTPMLMVPVKNGTSLARVKFDAGGFAEFRKQADFFSAHLFCLEGYTGNGNTSARHFCAPPDVIEDPFTGSATGAMACYLWKYRLLRQHEFVAEQGHNICRPGEAFVRVFAEGDQIHGVSVSGYAATSMYGEILAGS